MIKNFWVIEIITIEKALMSNAKKKEHWLYIELVKGLEQVGVKVWIEEESMKLETPFNTFLYIENENGKKYVAGLRQKIKIKKG